MAIFEQQKPQYHQDLEEEEEDYYNEGGESDAEYDSDMDPSYCVLEESTRGKLAKLSIKKKSKFRIGKNLEMDADVEIDPEEAEMNVGEIDEKSFKQVQEIIEAGKLEKLKVEQCKVYLRKNGLRLTGNKDTLIQRIKEHQEILNGGEKKYPVSSFVLDCKGDACTGDVVMFEQNVYELYDIASRSARGPPCGTRIVAGRIVKESYGAVKQQHTFTIEVLWSKGEKPLCPLHPLLIKGRNLYRLKTLRQRWENEEERRKILIEKHSRGSLARCARETRIQEKERRKVLRENRALTKEERNRNQSQLYANLTANQEIHAQQSGSSINLGKAAPEPRLLGSSVDSRKMSIQLHSKMGGGAQKLIQPHHSGSSILPVKVGNGTQQLAILPQPWGSFANREKMEGRHLQPAAQPQRSGSSIDMLKMGNRPLRLGIQPQQSDILADSLKQTNRPPQRSGFSFETGKLPFQPKLQKHHRENDNSHRVPHNLVDYRGIQEVEQHNCDKVGSWLSNFYTNDDHHRQPLRSMKHYQAMDPVNRNGYLQQKLCKFYAQGRCYYGDNCKFLHDPR
ncbi:hypothetical protein P3X46_011224 [Hevea brasiliensis]|uniref:C3H1-type domain-containing protein n=1 Tax=Hevea brasiliensis TaxID=3981 RepID=A0ABQ9MK04_HEVBR|nr:zinc finger CCCH domain-containing protein 62 [Hevea brasiliensis]KAJ9179436.1 hypothetical protein P3X46_011224 [Hevea brasiliensis]